MKFKIFIVVFLLNSFAQMEILGVRLNFYLRKPTQVHLPTNNLQTTWPFEHMLSSASSLNPFSQDYFPNINTHALIPKTYNSAWNPEISSSLSNYNTKGWIPPGSSNLESHSFATNDWNNYGYNAQQESNSWNNAHQPVDSFTKNYDYSKNEDNSYKKPQNNNAWKGEIIPSVSQIVEVDNGFKYNNNFHYSTTSKPYYVEKKNLIKPSDLTNIDYGPPPTPTPEDCETFPVQDLTNEPIPISPDQPLPKNYSESYSNKVTIDNSNGRCNAFSMVETFLNKTEIPVPKKFDYCNDQGDSKITVKIIKLPTYSAPTANEKFEAELQKRDSIGSRKILKPFEDQLNALGQVYSFIKTLDKASEDSFDTNKTQYYKVQASPYVIFNQRFNLREPDTSDKSVLNAFYNFAIPKTDVGFRDLDIFQEYWKDIITRAELENPEEDYGVTDEEIENTVSDIVFQNIDIVESNLKAAAEDALNILYSPLGSGQYNVTVCSIPALTTAKPELYYGGYSGGSYKGLGTSKKGSGVNGNLSRAKRQSNNIANNLLQGSVDYQAFCRHCNSPSSGFSFQKRVNNGNINRLSRNRN